jgi:hypothetical protein
MQFTAHDGPGPGLAPVHRFYSAAAGELGAHFFTAFEHEHDAVKGNPAWTYEGIAFYAALPDADGTCAAGTAPMFRVFDGRRHRLMHSREIRRLAVDAGAVAEGAGADGVAFCVPVATEVAEARVTDFARGIWTLQAVPGMDPWPDSLDFAGGHPRYMSADDPNFAPFLGTTTTAQGTGTYNRVGGPERWDIARASWQPFTGEILVAIGTQVFMRLDYRGGETVTGCWHRIEYTVDEPPFFWSAPCVPLTGRRTDRR